jgi:hypothetical protein
MHLAEYERGLVGISLFYKQFTYRYFSYALEKLQHSSCLLSVSTLLLFSLTSVLDISADHNGCAV